MKSRPWTKYSFKSPKVSDAAEEAFEIKLVGGVVVGNCSWLRTDTVTGRGGAVEGFHYVADFGAVPIAQNCVTHWRRIS